MMTEKPKMAKLYVLALVLFVIVPLAMAPNRRNHDHVGNFNFLLEVSGCVSPLCGGLVIEERDGSDNLVREIVHRDTTTLWQLLSDGSAHYFSENPLGHTAMLTDGTGSPGAVLERYVYTDHGTPVFQDAANQGKTDRSGNPLAESEFGNTLLFGGRWYDPETGSRSGIRNDDFGGLYLFGSRYYNPDEGRYVTRAGPGGEEIYPDEYGRTKVQFATTAGNRYSLAGNAPVNQASGPMPQTREHILLARQVGLAGAGTSSATGRRTYEPIVLRKRIDKSVPAGRKMPGRTTYADITLKRGIFHSIDRGPLDIQQGGSGQADPAICTPDDVGHGFEWCMNDDLTWCLCKNGVCTDHCVPSGSGESDGPPSLGYASESAGAAAPQLYEACIEGKPTHRPPAADSLAAKPAAPPRFECDVYDGWTICVCDGISDCIGMLPMCSEPIVCDSDGICSCYAY